MSKPDFGYKYEQLPNGMVLACKYAAPGLTFQDIRQIFTDAEKQWTETDDFLGDPTRWKHSRGLNAVLDAILEAVYSEDKNAQ